MPFWFAVMYNFFFLSTFLRCLLCARFRSHFLSHLPSPFVLLVVFSCLNATQQSSPNPSTTVAKTSKATLSFEVVHTTPILLPIPASDIPMAKPPRYLLRRHFPWSPDAHSDLVYNFVTERETKFKWIARGISAYDGIYVEEKTQNRKELRCIYWAISLKRVLRCTTRTKRLKETSEHL